jgi:hypothetical protein
VTDKYAEAWRNIALTMPHLTSQQLHRVAKMCRRELADRWAAREALKERAAAGFLGLANFMAGVTWAMSCRQALRGSKGHTPVNGRRAQSGEMWLPRELLYCVRNQVKDRTWHPLTAESWSVVKSNLEAEERASRPLPAGYVDSFNAVRFVIPFAKQEARAVVAVDRRFDDPAWDNMYASLEERIK